MGGRCVCVWAKASSSRCPVHCSLARVSFSPVKNVRMFCSIGQWPGGWKEPGELRKQNVFKFIFIYTSVCSCVRMWVLGGRKGLRLQDPWRHTAPLLAPTSASPPRGPQVQCAESRGIPLPYGGLKRLQPQWPTGASLSSQLDSKTS